ncbi:acetylajmaline esterase [Ranunculus cassubicifolius]
MGSASPPRLFFFFALFLLSSAFLPSASAASNKTCPFQSVYQFGDSINDAGNLIREGPLGSISPCHRLPYGQALYGRSPTGRCSNGLLMIDYITSAINLPQLPPYLQQNTSVDHGVNFAVAGSAALGTAFFNQRNLHIPATNTPLTTQLSWFQNHLSHVCHNEIACAERLQRSLVFMGEIGGNDYNAGFFQSRSVREILTYVPEVVRAITDSVREVIHAGALHVVVPGNFPVGCFPIYLNQFRTSNSRAYDDMGCLIGMNRFARYHNNYLQRALDQLRREFPNVVILYGDYYTAFQSVLRRAPALGFDGSSVLRACCGTGGRYNFDITRQCGFPGTTVCRNPVRSISWDGIHLTQNAYMHMAQWLLADLLPKMQCRW